jgi:hypothetical protein
MLNPQPTAGALLMYGLLFRRQFLATWFLCRHEDLYLGKHGCQETQVLPQPAPGGYRIRSGKHISFVSYLHSTARITADSQDPSTQLMRYHFILAR